MRHSFLNTLVVAIISLATCLCLSYSIFGAGLYICTTPEATKSIGSTFSGWDKAVFPKDDMANIAENVRQFSLGEKTADELSATVNDAIQKNYPQVSSALNSGDLSNEQLQAELVTKLGTTSLSQLSQRYSLPQDAISHLSDCISIFTTGRISIGVLCGLGLAGLVILGVMRGRGAVGKALIVSALIVLVLIAALILWAVVDFNSLFSAMHSVFFAKGTWLFDSNSLLIQLFPEAFWIAMAALWALTSIILSILVLIAGKIVKH